MLIERKVLRKDEHNQFFGRIDGALRCSNAAPAEGTECSQGPGQPIIDSNGNSQPKAVPGRDQSICPKSP